MKVRIFYIFSLMLLCISCSIKETPQLDYVGGGGSNEYRMLEVRIPDDWKIVNAKLKPKQFIVEFDRGNGAEKQNVHLPFPIIVTF